MLTLTALYLILILSYSVYLKSCLVALLHLTHGEAESRRKA